MPHAKSLSDRTGVRRPGPLAPAAAAVDDGDDEGRDCGDGDGDVITFIIV